MTKPPNVEKVNIDVDSLMEIANKVIVVFQEAGLRSSELHTAALILLICREAQVHTNLSLGLFLENVISIWNLSERLSETDESLLTPPLES